MNIGILFIGIAIVCSIVCLLCMVHDTIPHEAQHKPQHTIDYNKLNPVELWEVTTC